MPTETEGRQTLGFVIIEMDTKRALVVSTERSKSLEMVAKSKVMRRLREMTSLREIGENVIKVLAAGEVGVGLCQRAGQMTELQRTCYHEASHCVVGYLSQQTPLRVWVAPGSRGAVMFSAPDHDTTETATGEIETAERRSDAAKIKAVAWVMASAGEPVDLSMLKAETEKLLLTNWSLVDTLAQALLRGRQLNHEQLKAYCEFHSERRAHVVQ